MNFGYHPEVSTREEHDQPEHLSKKSDVSGMQPVSVKGTISEMMFVDIIR
jgi:hypothetical protein